MSEQTPTLTNEDAHNLLVLLERVPVTGTKEAFVLSQLAGKLQALAAQATQTSAE